MLVKENQNTNNQLRRLRNECESSFMHGAWVKALIPKNHVPDDVSFHLTFESIVLYNWHTHAGSQILMVTDGTGYYQEKGKTIQPLGKGMVIFVPPNVPHWHAAKLDSNFTHVNIRSNDEEEIVTWLQKTIDNQ